MAPKQGRFVEEYLVDLNASQAALRAGYSPHTAPYIGHENLKKPQIQAAIAAAMAERSRRTQITQDRVLEELAALSFSNIEHYSIGKTGEVLLVAGAPVGANRAVASLKKKVMFTEQGEIYETEIKLWNKPQTLKMLGDHLGLFRDDRLPLDETFVTGFVAVVQQHLGAESVAHQAIRAYLAPYLGPTDSHELVRAADGSYGTDTSR